MDYDLYCILRDDSKTDNSSCKLIPSIATGHAVRTLLNEDIRPDVIIITDPKPDMYKQVKALQWWRSFYKQEP